MTVVGIGVDLVEIHRMTRMLERHGDRALNRLLTSGERKYCLGRARPAQHVAARVAAKEATYKALQNADDAADVSWLHVEVIINAAGRPELRLSGPARGAADRLGVQSALLSISHSVDTAIAMVVLNGSA